MLASLTIPSDLAGQIALLKKFGYLAPDWVAPEGIALAALLAWIAMLIFMLVKFFLKR